MGEGPKVPVFVAVGFWFASALAVASYTWIAVKETANGLEAGALDVVGAENPLIASADVIAAEVGPKQSKRSLRSLLPTITPQQQKKFLERGKFPGSK